MLDIDVAADFDRSVGPKQGESYFKVPTKLTYESAVLALNSLQSNAETVRKARLEQARNPPVNVQDTAAYLSALGIHHSQLTQLKAIHVSGTKGKGSVCANVEAVLRARGCRTGFFSSPHLIHVRERIRIDGRPISESQFASHFWSVYGGIASALPLACGGGRSLNHMPAYFKFLTVMAFKVFITERVDVAVIEVGIGGEYDCTNVITSPVVCGITSLDYDHIEMLGATLESIAWHKAGILKAHCAAVTVRQDERAAHAVIERRAAERQCELSVAPPLSAYSGLPDRLLANLQPPNRANVSLALQLADRWYMNVKGKSVFSSDCTSTTSGSAAVLPEVDSNSNVQCDSLYPIDGDLSTALLQCKWPGRTHVLRRSDNLTVFLDGAHTPKSLQLCSDWFCEQSFKRAESAHRVLVFHCTGQRAAHTLLQHLPVSLFATACFCPQVATATSGMDPASDQSSRHAADCAHNAQRCWHNAAAYQQLVAGCDTLRIDNAPPSPAGDAPPPPPPSVNVFHSAQQCVEFVDALAAGAGAPVHMLITGSLHLVGAFMSVLGEDLD